MKRRIRRTKQSDDLKALAEKRAKIQLIKREAAQMDSSMLADMYVYACERKVYHNDDTFLAFIDHLEHIPVTIEEFIDDEDFLGATDLILWPVVRKAVIEINKDWYKGEQGGAQTEMLLMGATSTGKSEIQKVTMAYHLHLLGCLDVPQSLFTLPKSTAIVMMIQSAKPHVTKQIIYQPLRNYIETMPWFQEHMRFNKYIESEMYFEDKNVRVVKGGSDSDSVLGEAIIASCLDEVNFMDVVEQSKRGGLGEGGKGGKYDQARNLYDTLTRRRKGRFLYSGPHIGMVGCSSSTRYNGDFTDKRLEEIQEQGLTNIYVYNEAQYDVWPQDRYCGEKFRLLVQNQAAADIRILEPQESVGRDSDVIEVPIEHKQDFINDPSGSLRDIIGKSVNALNPFFRNREKIMEAIMSGEGRGLASFLAKDNVILGLEGMPVITKGHYCENPGRPRYVHIDLSKNGDACGIAMVRFDGFTDIERENGVIETLPMAACEMAVGVQPDHGHELDLGEVRAWVRWVKEKCGYPIRAVTYDGWNSLESQQQWKKQGVKSGQISVDKTDIPYKHLRAAIYDGRFMLFGQQNLVDEFYGLEWDEKKGKVDHPPKGSKDIADAVCGAYTTLLTRSKTWQGYETRDERHSQDARFEEERSP